jgi:Flp pilus assembly protein TadG
MVEFAMVAPLFFLLFFGIVEFSLINASIGAFNFAAKDAARFGAIMGKSNVAVGTTIVPTDQYIVNNVILPHVSGVVVAQMTKVEIYNSDETGACVIVSGACQEDIYQYASGGWQSTSDTWRMSDRNDQLANADYLGVRISYTYTYLTALFAISSPTINLQADSIQRIEPQQYGDRYDPGTHSWVSALPGWSPIAALFASPTDVAWLRRTEENLMGGRV